MGTLHLAVNVPHRAAEDFSQMDFVKVTGVFSRFLSERGHTWVKKKVLQKNFGLTTLHASSKTSASSKLVELVSAV